MDLWNPTFLWAIFVATSCVGCAQHKQAPLQHRTTVGGGVYERIADAKLEQLIVEGAPIKGVIPVLAAGAATELQAFNTETVVQVLGGPSLCQYGVLLTANGAGTPGTGKLVKFPSGNYTGDPVWEVVQGAGAARGWRPRIRTTSVNAISSGSTLIAEIYEAYHRIYFITGKNGKYWLTTKPDTIVSVPAGYYVEYNTETGEAVTKLITANEDRRRFVEGILAKKALIEIRD